MNTDILINALKEYDMLKQMEICNANIMLLSNIQGENEWVVAWQEFDQYLIKKCYEVSLWELKRKRQH